MDDGRNVRLTCCVQRYVEGWGVSKNVCAYVIDAQGLNGGQCRDVCTEHLLTILSTLMPKTLGLYRSPFYSTKSPSFHTTKLAHSLSSHKYCSSSSWHTRNNRWSTRRFSVIGGIPASECV